MVLGPFGGSLGLLLGARGGLLGPLLSLQIDPKGVRRSGPVRFGALDGLRWLRVVVIAVLPFACSCFRFFDVMAYLLLASLRLDVGLPGGIPEPEKP